MQTDRRPKVTQSTRRTGRLAMFRLRTFAVVLCAFSDGAFGYMPTEQECLAGGYEPATSPFIASAAGHFVAAVSRHLREIHAARD